MPPTELERPDEKLTQAAAMLPAVYINKFYAATTDEAVVLCFMEVRENVAAPRYSVAMSRKNAEQLAGLLNALLSGLGSVPESTTKAN